MKYVTLFCGSRTGTSPLYLEAAQKLGHWIGKTATKRPGESPGKSVGHDSGQDQITLVYGGGRVGLMGIAADAVLQAGGSVVGVITHQLMKREVGHPGLTRMEISASMAERKTRLIQMGQAFVILPGGFGTLDELFEVLTLSQLGDHLKPVLVVDIENYFEGLFEFTRRALRDDFLDQVTANLMHRVQSIEAMLEWLETWSSR